MSVAPEQILETVVLCSPLRLLSHVLLILILIRRKKIRKESRIRRRLGSTPVIVGSVA